MSDAPERNDGRSPFETREELYLSPDYGPHICQSCYGAGWMRSTVEIGTLVKCQTCGTVEARARNRLIARCWEVSGLKPGDVLAPTLRSYKMIDHAAETIRRAAAHFIHEPAGWLTIYGIRGSGKTHIGEAITRALLAAHVPCLMMTSSRLWEYCGAVKREPGDDTDYPGRRRWVTDVPVLVIDELGKERETEAIQEYRFGVLTDRYTLATRGEGGATVLLSNDDPAQWVDTAIASRAGDTRFVCLASPASDYRQVGGSNGERRRTDDAREDDR